MGKGASASSAAKIVRAAGSPGGHAHKPHTSINRQINCISSIPAAAAAPALAAQPRSLHAIESREQLACCLAGTSLLLVDELDFLNVCFRALAPAPHGKAVLSPKQGCVPNAQQHSRNAGTSVRLGKNRKT